MQALAGRIPVNKPEVKKHLIVNKDETEFILVSLGYHKPTRWATPCGNVR